MTSSEVGKVLKTILSTPGMNDSVKIDAKITRKQVLLLNHVIELGLAIKSDERSGLLTSVPDENLEELRVFARACLEKAELTELSEELKSLTVSK